MGRDPIGIVEAAYVLDGPESAWLHHVLAAARPELDQGMGLFAFTYAFASSPITPSAMCALGVGREIQSAAAELLKRPDFLAAGRRARFVSRGIVPATTSEVLGAGFARFQPFHERLGPLGVRDFVGFMSLERDGTAFVLSVPLPRRTRLAEPRRRRWARLAVHIAAGLRVRRALAGEAEAVLTVDGRIEHAQGFAAKPESRRELAKAVRGMDRARGKLRRSSPDQALSIWRGLVAGRWSILDAVERGGARFVIARRNDPPTRRHGALTLAERQVIHYAAQGHSNKLIAYELGIGESAVAMRLSRAASKLGARSRAELLSRLVAIGPPARR